MIVRLSFLLLLLAPASGARAEATDFPARSPATPPQQLVVYSSLDEPLALPMLNAFQSANPTIAVRYEEMLTGEIYDRIVHETDAGQKTADFAFSSAMDLQVKLANDGYAQPSRLPLSASWPQWANWRDTAYALTFEPARVCLSQAELRGSAAAGQPRRTRPLPAGAGRFRLRSNRYL